MRIRPSIAALVVLASIGTAWAGDLPSEVEPNDSLAQANDASLNFEAVTGNVFHMGFSGSIGTSTDSDYFNVGQLQVGDVITAGQYGLFSDRGTNSDTQVRLYRASTMAIVAMDDDGGPPAAPGGDALLWRHVVTTADSYVVRAHRFLTSNTGTYQVGLYLEDIGAPPSTGSPFSAETEPNNTVATANNASFAWRAVQYRAVTSAAITPADADYFNYQFTSGDRISVIVDSTSGLDARVNLRNASGAIIASEDGSSVGPGADSPMYAFVIPTTGSYVVEVQAAAGTGTYDLVVELSGAEPPMPAFSDLGSGLAGVNGVPALSGSGSLAAATPGSLSLTSAAPSSPSMLFVALSSAPVPFKGGLLVAYPFTLTFPLFTNGTGALHLPFTWPSGVPAATSLYFQYAILDAAAPQGVSLSNAVKGVTP